MQTLKNKKTALFALFLILAMAISIFALPPANAHTPPWTFVTHAYVVASPNPVGVGQQVLIVAFSNTVIMNAYIGNDARWRDWTITITKPDGKTETIKWGIVWDTTSAAYTLYTPDQVGTYKFVLSYPDLKYIWNITGASGGNSGAFINDTYLGATSDPYYLTVQQSPIPPAQGSYPLPTEYWTRPIEGQNNDWWAIASNWLGTGNPKYAARFQPDGTAPNSPHIMWTKTMELGGGVVGGSNTAGVAGDTFYTGLSYNSRFGNPIIMQGVLYYQEPLLNAGSGGNYVAVDLRTGAELWRTNLTAGTPSFGQYYDYQNPNQHGIIPEGLLYTSNFARAYDPVTGIPTTYNMTNVPSGTAAIGPNGEILRITVTNIGNTTNPNWRLTQWNNTKMYGAGMSPANYGSGTVNAGLASNYDWNVSISTNIPTNNIRNVVFDDVLIGSNLDNRLPGGMGLTAWGTIATYTVWAISLKPSSRGTVLWMKNYSAPPEDEMLSWIGVDPVNRVFIISNREAFASYGYSIDDGSLLWTSTRPNATGYEMWSTGGSIAYGRYYYTGLGGILYCTNTKNGKIEWTYGNGGAGNTTWTWNTAWGHYPLSISCIADGKIYLTTSEHSPNTPLYKNALLRCVDAYNGTEIWTLMEYGTSGMAVADGTLIYWNAYDGQVYAIGKGPSATTAEAPMTAVTAGDSVVIRGTVTDISAGTKQKEQAARFPNGVPAVSDASMEAWMEYVYMQKPHPANATGVDVTLDAVDPNGNFVHLGTVTSDTSSLFHYAWKTPDVPGEYTVIATFAGSESYWPSYAETAMVVSEAPPATPPPPAAQPLPPIEMYFIAATVAIIIAVAIVGLMLLRKRP